MNALKLLLFLLLASFASNSTTAQQNTVFAWKNLVGAPGGSGMVDGVGSAARFNFPASVAISSAGNIYVADTSSSTVRKITPAGDVTTFAGLASVSGSTDGTGAAARFSHPYGLVVNRNSDTIYVSDNAYSTIRRIASDGVVTTFAGSPLNTGTNDGFGNAARFRWPTGLAIDDAGTLYVADCYNHTIRKVTGAGVVTTLAGSPGSPGSLDGTNGGARFNYPIGVACDHLGNVYVADGSNQTLRVVSAAGVVTTLAGSVGNPGSVDGSGVEARFNSPCNVAVDSKGLIFVSESGNHTIRQVTTSGEVTTLAGTAGVSGSADGIGAAASFVRPSVAADASGNLWVADSGNSTIRKVTSAGVVTTLAGTPPMNGSADGTGTLARFNLPFGVVSDNQGNIFVADGLNHTIRKVTGGNVSTVAGLAGTSGTNDGVGTSARFNVPANIACDPAGNVYVADYHNHTIRKITSDNVVTTLAGLGGVSGTNDGIGAAARFTDPWGVAVGSGGILYVADAFNHTIRKVTSSGSVTTLAGLPGTSGSADGTGNGARFYAPSGIVVDGAGDILVADCNNQTIRKVTSDGVVTTLAGKPRMAGAVDGAGGDARFNLPNCIVMDRNGTFFVADAGSSLIRRVTTAGVVTTVGGTANIRGSADGAAGFALFSRPYAVAADSSGCLYIADTYNNRISQGVPWPTLNVSAPENSVKVSWPSPFTNYALQENTNLTSVLGWKPSLSTIIDDGTNKNVTVTAPPLTRHFRLKQN